MASARLLAVGALGSMAVVAFSADSLAATPVAAPQDPGTTSAALTADVQPLPMTGTQPATILAQAAPTPTAPAGTAASSSDNNVSWLSSMSNLFSGWGAASSAAWQKGMDAVGYSDYAYGQAGLQTVRALPDGLAGGLKYGDEGLLVGTTIGTLAAGPAGAEAGFAAGTTSGFVYGFFYGMATSPVWKDPAPAPAPSPLDGLTITNDVVPGSTTGIGPATGYPTTLYNELGIGGANGMQGQGTSGGAAWPAPAPLAPGTRGDIGTGTTVADGDPAPVEGPDGGGAGGGTVTVAGTAANQETASLDPTMAPVTGNQETAGLDPAMTPVTDATDPLTG